MDRHWLLGEPAWWGSKSDPPDFRTGELSPEESWVSTTPRIGNFGWCRQRLRPLAWPLLRPLAWAPFFLIMAAVPLALPGRTPDDQLTSLLFFSICWTLVIIPLSLARNSQPMSSGSLLSLPVDWYSLALASVIFPLHILMDAKIGWISYAIYWVAYLRTIHFVQAVMIVPPSRFLLPLSPKDWEGDLENPWKIFSKKWSSRKLASVKLTNGEIVLSGAHRSGQTFLALAFVHVSGFLQDPFHEGLSKEPGLSDLLSKNLPFTGREWPNYLLPVTEEE